MLKAVILLFSIIVSIDGGVMRKRSDDQTLMEIIKTLRHITEEQMRTADCRNTMVPDIFSDKKHQGVSQTFCKAAKALKNITPCQPIQHNMEKLQLNLLKAGEKISTCTVHKHSLTDLNTFLKELVKFSKRTYSQ